MTDKRVGMVGLGIMGGAISANLAERGWAVTGFDVDATRCAEATAAGVSVVASAAEVAARCDLVMTSLPNPAAAEAVAKEIAATPAPRIIAELSTFTLQDKMRFRDLLAARGHTVLDCPLSGTGAQAKVRDLIVYASGDDAAIARFTPVFADFAKQSAGLGVYGNGSRLKFVANLLVAIHNVASAEALMLAEAAGLDIHQVVDLVGPGAGGSRMFQLRAPMMADRHYTPPTMRVATWKKDMTVIGAFAKELGVETPLFSLTAPVYDEAIAIGLGDQDTAAVFEVLKRRQDALRRS
jgi:putative dehydrogenase